MGSSSRRYARRAARPHHKAPRKPAGGQAGKVPPRLGRFLDSAGHQCRRSTALFIPWLTRGTWRLDTGGRRIQSGAAASHRPSWNDARPRGRGPRRARQGGRRQRRWRSVARDDTHQHQMTVTSETGTKKHIGLRRTRNRTRGGRPHTPPHPTHRQQLCVCVKRRVEPSALWAAKFPAPAATKSPLWRPKSCSPPI